MPTIYVDGRAFEVDGSRNLLQTCLSLGFNLPYFCWHFAMGSVGACRQCAVKQFKDANDTRGRIVMACMTPAADGTRISIEDPDAVAFRAGVIQGLMQNHPHDCPVCDEGGECHLQDMTLMTGHDYRRYSFSKRTFRNQYLGPFLNHEMNRCIQCYRCVRFYRDYAGGDDLNAFSLHNTVFFGRDADGVLENEFGGNLAEVCPTGVFTDATLKHHYTRKWDLQMAPSVCVHCGLGCNTIPGERYGVLRRIYNRYNRDVNGYFLCDRGRFGYEFVNSDRRIREPLLRRGDTLQPATAEEAVARVAELLGAPGGDPAAPTRSGDPLHHTRRGDPPGRPSSSIGIGSPRASLEANFALRTLVGPDRFYAGVADDVFEVVSAIADVLRDGPAPIASLHDAEQSDAVLVLGEDVLNTAPRLALALRQAGRQEQFKIADRLHVPRWLDLAVREAGQDRHSPLFIATPAATKLDTIATATCQAAPDDIARLGFAVARAIDGGAPAVAEMTADLQALADRIAAALTAADRPLVVSGAGCRTPAIVHAAANVARALRHAGKTATIALCVPECNSTGLALLAPRPLGEAVNVLRTGSAETVVVLENDLYHRVPAPLVDALLGAAQHLVAIDCLATRTTARAEVVLPAGTFAEADGTLVSNEGRAQRFFQVIDPGAAPEPGRVAGTTRVQESWRWLRDAMQAAGRVDGPWPALDDVIEAIARELPSLAGIRDAAPPAAFRLAGDRVPRQPSRYSGRTAMRAHVSVKEPDRPADLDSPLKFSMEGYRAQPPAPLTTFFWAPAWNSVQSVGKFQEEINGPLRGGPTGLRLLDNRDMPGKGQASRYVEDVPAKSRRKPGELLAVPLYHVFGSDELAHFAPAVAELAPAPYVALAGETVLRLALAAGQNVDLVVGEQRWRLPVVVEPSLPDGVAGVPVGLRGLDAAVLPAAARIEVPR